MRFNKVAAMVGSRSQSVRAATGDRIVDAGLLIAAYSHTRSVGISEVVVEALVDGVGDFPGIAEDCGVRRSR